MAVKVKGLKKVKQNLAAIVGEIQATKSVRAMRRITSEIAILAAKYTPVDTSTLINSQYTSISSSGTRITGTVGYSAKYAVYVHDPNIKQNFTKPTAKKEFLTSALAESKDTINAIIKQEFGL